MQDQHIDSIDHHEKFVVQPDQLHVIATLILRTQSRLRRITRIFPCLHQKTQKQSEKMEKLVQTEKDASKKRFLLLCACWLVGRESSKALSCLKELFFKTPKAVL
jgi:hypothetical protein